MFPLDRFYPSSTGYERTSQALLPAVERAWHGRELDASVS